MITQRLMKLQMKGSHSPLPAEILIKRRKRSKSHQDAWEVVRAKGHLDEVLELRAQLPPSKVQHKAGASPKP